MEIQDSRIPHFPAWDYSGIFEKKTVEDGYRANFDKKNFSLRNIWFDAVFCDDSKYDIYFIF
jgi:hypothetical protein